MEDFPGNCNGVFLSILGDPCHILPNFDANVYLRKTVVQKLYIWLDYRIPGHFIYICRYALKNNSSFVNGFDPGVSVVRIV